MGIRQSTSQWNLQGLLATSEYDKVIITTLGIMNPPPDELPPKLRRGLGSLQEVLLKAWESVREVPPGSSPGVW